MKTYTYYKTAKKTAKENNLAVGTMENEYLFDLSLLEKIENDSDREAIKNQIIKQSCFGNLTEFFGMDSGADDFHGYVFQARMQPLRIFSAQNGNRLYVIWILEAFRYSSKDRTTVWDEYDVVEQTEKNIVGNLADVEI